MPGRLANGLQTTNGISRSTQPRMGQDAPPIAPLSVLVVDDDPAIGRIFRDLIAAEDVHVDVEMNLASARERIRKPEPIDVLFLDLNLPDGSGEDFLDPMRQVRPTTLIVIITGNATVDSAVRLMKRGVEDYLVKPFKPSQVKALLDMARRTRRAKEESRVLRRKAIPDDAPRMVGMTPEMEGVVEVAQRVAREDCTVLIQGESGTGKEVLARLIHSLSQRRGGPFVTVDCGAISRSLIESELYGHERGAFTGAVVRKEGMLAQADTGTVFLDEIAEVPLDIQPTLLRVLEEKKIRRVGGTDFREINVRIIAATNRDLEKEVDAGRFRLDLFYRLNVVTVTLPPLRLRKDDIPLLVDHFFKKYNGRIGTRTVTGVAREAMFMLLRYDWPGNVRELEHILERALLVGRQPEIVLDDLPPSLMAAVERKTRPVETTVKPLPDLEKEAILRALKDARGDTALAADNLKLDRSTLYRRLKKMGLTPRDFK